MESIRTISCKLQVDPHQAERIEATLQAFADACNFVAEWGCTHKVRFQYALHKGCYQAVRERFGLSANLAVRAIARVAPRLRKAQTRNSRSQRGLHNSWAFYQLRQFVEYKARRAGVRVISIKPAYTSQMCSCCHHIGNRSRARFSCANCGAVMDADLNGALNIATVGAAVTRPEYSLLSCPLPQWVAEAAG